MQLNGPQPSSPPHESMPRLPVQRRSGYYIGLELKSGYYIALTRKLWITPGARKPVVSEKVVITLSWRARTGYYIELASPKWLLHCPEWLLHWKVRVRRQKPEMPVQASGYYIAQSGYYIALRWFLH